MKTTTPFSPLPPNLFVVGHGRSGTNMVLDLFDCHPSTFCRNEPNELAGTAFTGLGDPMFPDPAQPDFDANWHRAIAETIRTCGARDRFGVEKDYFRSRWRASVGQAVMSRGKLRACVLSRRGDTPVQQWPCPTFHYDLAAQARALPVMKILLTPAWILRAHDASPSQRVVHVVRQPQGFVQSWWGRYVSGIGGGPEKVFADNQPSLKRILKHFGREDAFPTGYSEYDLVVSELWRWRYVNEILLEKLSGTERYIKLQYEDVMRDKLFWAERIFAFAGIEMPPAARQAMSSMENTLFKARKPDALDPTLVADAINHVLADSPCRNELALTQP